MHLLLMLLVYTQTGPLITQGQQEIGGEVLHTGQQLVHLQSETLLQEVSEHTVKVSFLQEKQGSARKLIHDLLLAEFVRLLALFKIYVPKTR
jgi:hypothetical protein